MRARQEKITYPVQNSFKILKYAVPFFDMDFHCHSEYELVYITKGSGIRYIGNSIHKFQSGDMVLIGPDLAHIWITPEKYRQDQKTLKVEAIVLQFSRDLFSSMINTPEFLLISNLLSNTEAGLKVTDKGRDTVKIILERMLQCDGLQRFLLLLKVLDTLSRAEDLILLNSLELVRELHQTDKRINAVHYFVMTCYAQKISSKDAASIANMEQSAFCRFFKLKTKKTFTQFLNETRIDQVCQLLLEKKQPITQVAYKCGFNNMTNFYKQFKTYTKTTPLAFQKD
ncbi:MAG: AraC family transcriptional regulator [Candidatus Marinimicrobia bacterium]|nr:AraC family transcriptional regulator [Candidatus Neomarinimicrobiota bacterium]